MKTLRDLAKYAVVKYGMGPRHELPGTLLQELEIVEKQIRLNLTGNYYSDIWHRGDQSIEFNIGWKHGNWMLTLREPWNMSGQRNRYESVIIRAGRKNVLGQRWGEILVYPPTADDVFITDFEINVEERKFFFLDLTATLTCF